MAKRNVDLTSKEWRDLVFADKNKEFGAYQLRKSSDKRHNLAVVYTLIGLVIVFILILCYSKYSDYKAEQDAIALQEQREKMAAAELLLSNRLARTDQKHLARGQGKNIPVFHRIKAFA